MFPSAGALCRKVHSKIRPDYSACFITSHYLYRNLLLLSVMSLVLLLTGCFGGGGGSSNKQTNMIAAAATGYYDVTGTATVKTDNELSDIVITDMQAIAYKDHVHMFSMVNHLLYNIHITSISGSGYSGTVDIYRDGIKFTTATVSGMITNGSSINGTLTGTGAGNGTFNLIYSMSNSQLADLTRIDRTNSGFSWSANSLDSVVYSIDFPIDVSGMILVSSSVLIGNTDTYVNCNFYNDTVPISPIANTSVFNFSVLFNACSNTAVNGTYSGLGTLRSDTVLVIILYNDTNNAVYSTFDGAG